MFVSSNIENLGEYYLNVCSIVCVCPPVKSNDFEGKWIASKLAQKNRRILCRFTLVFYTRKSIICGEWGWAKWPNIPWI